MTKLAPALDAAITYAAHGLKSFPIKARSKAPATAHGFKDATADGGILQRRFLAAGVDANVGIATGDGLVVIELDGPDAKAWWASHGDDTPRTWHARSGRGGDHYYFHVSRAVKTTPLGPIAGFPEDGSRIKGEGGYVLAPPSVHPDGPLYEWVVGPDSVETSRPPGHRRGTLTGPAGIAPAPTWLLALFDAPRAATRAKVDAEPAEVVTTGQDDYGARRAATLAARGMPRPEAKAALEAMVATRFAGGWSGLDSSRPWSHDDVDRWLDGAYSKFFDPGAAKAAEADERLQTRTAAKASARPKDKPPSASRRIIPAADVDVDGVIGTLASDIEIKAVRWLWKGRLPAGMLVILDGDPGLGKSTIVADWMARVTRGEPWPDGEACPRGAAIYVGAEDPAAEVTIPRLRAAGADLAMVRVVTTVPTADGKERLPILPKDLDVFERVIRATGARLLVFDPIISYVAAELSSYSDKDVRQALTPLADMLAGTDCTGIMLRHLKKDDKASLAMYRGGGSIAFIAVARAGFAVSKVKGEDDVRALMPTKANLAPKPKSLRYTLEQVELPGGVETSRVLWGEATDDDADANMTAFGAEKPKSRDEAKQLLQEFLMAGPRPSAALEAEAEARGIALRTLKRAKEELDVRAKMVNEAWWCALPEHAQQLARVGAVRGTDGRLYAAGGRATSAADAENAADGEDSALGYRARAGAQARARAQEGTKFGTLNSEGPEVVALRLDSDAIKAEGQSARVPLTRARACEACGESAGVVRQRGRSWCAACGALA